MNLAFDSIFFDYVEKDFTLYEVDKWLIFKYSQTNFRNFSSQNNFFL